MTMNSPSRPRGFVASNPRGFSLVEVLIAVFILAIGIISISAMFPAGIALQRRTVDDTIGPIVAENALTVLRSKLKPEYFGADRSPSSFTPLRRFTIDGDWEWRRPVYFTEDVMYDSQWGFDTVEQLIPAGSISIFSSGDDIPGVASDQTTDYDNLQIPWNNVAFANYPYFISDFNEPVVGRDDPPHIFITQQDRFYPQGFNNRRPQYVWDCMFRSYQGRILVAIFVYRVTPQGGPASFTYHVAPRASDPNRPPVPIRLDLNTPPNEPWDAGMGANIAAPPNDATDPNLIPNTAADDPYDPFDDFQSWQLPGQYLLDQNNAVHRVLSGRETQADGPLELTRAIAPVLGVPLDLTNLAPGPPTWTPNFYYGIANTAAPHYGLVEFGIISDIWYLPEEMDVNGDGDMDYLLTPVYVTVREM